MALYKGSQKVSWSGNSFNPQNAGTTWQVLSKTASWYEWDDAPATGVWSSNNTYEDIIYLSQSDYDALTTKDPNTLYSTPDGEGWEPFDPSNAWTTGQVLTKTAWWYDWETIDALPSWGTTWQVLTKTASWADWEDVSWFSPESTWSTWQVLSKTSTWYDYKDSVLSWDSWTNYVIKVSSTAPASWTANNVITFVTD